MIDGGTGWGFGAVTITSGSVMGGGTPGIPPGGARKASIRDMSKSLSGAATLPTTVMVGKPISSSSSW